MVKVYLSDVSKLPDPLDNPELLNELPEERRDKILRFKQEKDRKQSLGAGLLLEQSLEQHGFDLADIRNSENGKPEIVGVHFNLSHSGDMVACVISEQPVGCDVEQMDKRRTGVAKRCFTMREFEYLDGIDEEKQNGEFYRIWTMKESYLKMTGEGITLALDRIEVIFDDDVSIFRDGKKEECYIREYHVPGYKLTVCAKEKVFADEAERIVL